MPDTNYTEVIPIMKKLLALMLAALMLVSAVACTDMGEDPNDSVVINIGTESMTYTDEATGDTFTYDYLNSTSVVITDFTSADFEPHTVTIPDTVKVVTKQQGTGTTTEMDMVVAAIGSRAFYAKSNVSEIKFNKSLQTIGDFAFANCEVLNNVDIPASVTTIGTAAFFGCDGLTTVKMNEGLKTLGDAAFYNCTALVDVTIPASTETIGESAFSDCTTLEELVIPEGVKTIGKFAFYNCTTIKKITLPASVEKIGLYALSTQLHGIEIEVEPDTEDGEVTIETFYPELVRPEGSYADKYIKDPPTADDLINGEEGEEEEN